MLIRGDDISIIVCCLGCQFLDGKLAFSKFLQSSTNMNYFIFLSVQTAAPVQHVRHTRTSKADLHR